MHRNENFAFIKLHRLHADTSIQSTQLKIDCRMQRVIARIPLAIDTQPIYAKFITGNEGNFKFNSELTVDRVESSIRVIRLGGVEDLNPLNYATEITNVINDNQDQPAFRTLHPAIVDLDDAIPDAQPARGSKVPNIPMMVRCQNCDTNFPTKYQFQRHQCEFNADKVVLKANIDAKDCDKGVRIKYDCPVCGKQFVSKNNLDRHVTCHDADNVNFCEFCNKQFVSENRLRIHKENHCKRAGDVGKFYRSDVSVFRCTKCFEVFSSEKAALSHVDNCNEIVTDPVAIKEANEHVTKVAVDLKIEEKFRMIEEGGSGPSSPINLSSLVSKFIERICTEQLLQCEFCNKTFANTKSLLYHQEAHTTTVNYNCVTCPEIFDSFVDAAKHWLTNCANKMSLFFLPKLLYCKVCDRTFKSHEVLYTHKIKKKHYVSKRHTGANYEYLENGAEGPSNLVQVKPDTAVVQHKGQKKETIIRLIEDVLDSIKKKTAEMEIDEGTASEGEADQETACVKTEVTSPNGKQSQEPQEEVPKKKRGRKRKHPVQPAENNSVVHPVLAPGYKLQCERCVAVFDTVLDLEVHRNREHPANHKCQECGQVLQSSKALVIHSRAHKSLKPYVCDICKRCYSQTSHLWQHMRFHQGIKPFACPHEGCEARYTIRPDLKDHIRKVHTRERPFKCSVCNKCFLTGSVYYQHRLIHTNDRRYACDICNKRFFRADALNNHRRIHTDERPYPCNVCGRQFRQKGDRNKHVRTQHPEFQM